MAYQVANCPDARPHKGRQFGQPRFIIARTGVGIAAASIKIGTFARTQSATLRRRSWPLS